jgi:hypothetical protein
MGPMVLSCGFRGAQTSYSPHVTQKPMTSVYSKLNQARTELQRRKLAKTGHNKFAGYKYFELGDFLPTVQEIFAQVGLCGIVSYGADAATLTIVDVEAPDATSIVISSPMSSAALKGAHDIQNLGAVQTYLRRYLWVTAMEIVEHDELDATLGAPKEAKEAAPAPKRARTPAPGDSVAPARQASIQEDLEMKMKELGLTVFGKKTFLKLCNSESFGTIADSKAAQAYKIADSKLVSNLNSGKNSKGEQILQPPVVEKPNKDSIEDLERAASALFTGDEEG